MFNEKNQIKEEYVEHAKQFAQKIEAALIQKYGKRTGQENAVEWRVLTPAQFAGDTGRVVTIQIVIHATNIVHKDEKLLRAIQGVAANVITLIDENGPQSQDFTKEILQDDLLLLQNGQQSSGKTDLSYTVKFTFT